MEYESIAQRTNEAVTLPFAAGSSRWCGTALGGRFDQKSTGRKKILNLQTLKRIME